MEETLLETATEILGKDRKKNKPWVTDDILDLCDLRRTFKKTKKDDPEAAKQHTLVNKNIRKRMREAKEKWITEQCESIDAGIRQGNSKAAYATLKKLTKTQQPTATIIKDKDGSLLTEKAAVTKRWTEYCQELYNFTIRPDPNILTNATKSSSECEDAPILQAEVEEAVRSLKTGKSPGIDNIQAELWKHGGQEMIKALTHICQRIWETKQWPQKWTQSLIIPIPKKGNSRQCQNHRTISLICHASKVLLRIILNRLKSKAEEIISEEQAGFRPRRSTTEQIFNIRLLIEKHLQHQHGITTSLTSKKPLTVFGMKGCGRFSETTTLTITSYRSFKHFTHTQAVQFLLTTPWENFLKQRSVSVKAVSSPLSYLTSSWRTSWKKHFKSSTPPYPSEEDPSPTSASQMTSTLWGKSEAELQELTTRLEEVARAWR